MKPETLYNTVNRIAMTHSIDISGIKHIFLVDQVKSLLPDSGFIKLPNKKDQYIVYMYVRKKTAPVNRWQEQHNILAQWENPEQPRSRKRKNIRVNSAEHPDIVSIMRERLAYFGDDAPTISQPAPNGRGRPGTGPSARTREYLSEYQELTEIYPDNKIGWYASQMGLKYGSLYILLKTWGHLLPKKEVDSQPEMY